MIRSVLVPLDGSPFGEQALPLAWSIARRAGATVEVVHVHTPFEFYRVPSAVAPDLDEQARQDKQTYLQGIVQRLPAEGKVPGRATLLVGDPTDALYDHIVAQGVDLVVLTTHGRGPLSRLWLGSIADVLVRRLPIPVLLIRPQEHAPSWNPEPVMQHLLVPLDGSELAEQILEPALELGTLMGAQLTLLQVIKPMHLPDEETQAYLLSETGRSLLEQLQQMQQQQQEEALAYLQRIAERLRGRGVSVQPRVVSGQPAAAILEVASEQRIDLIALATRGRGGLVRLLLGSVADKVIRGASLPILVQRPRDK